MRSLFWHFRVKLAYWITPPLFPPQDVDDMLMSVVRDGRGGKVEVYINKRGKVKLVRCDQ